MEWLVRRGFACSRVAWHVLFIWIFFKTSQHPHIFRELQPAEVFQPRWRQDLKLAARILHSIVSHAEVQQHLQGLGISWVFNLSAWGTIWSSHLVNKKCCLHKIVGQAKLSWNELLTAMIEAEGVLNSHPLTKVSAWHQGTPHPYALTLWTPNPKFAGPPLLNCWISWCRCRSWTNKASKILEQGHQRGSGPMEEEISSWIAWNTDTIVAILTHLQLPLMMWWLFISQNNFVAYGSLVVSSKPYLDKMARFEVQFCM